jgi:hypothetical protein
MALTISASPSGDFQPAPSGTFPAICIRVIDMGTQRTDYQGDVKMQHKILLQFEIQADKEDAEFRMSDGRPFVISKRYTASLHEKSAFRKDLISWRGRDFSEDELSAFDVGNVLGKPCMLNVVHTTKDGKNYANIGSLMKLPKGMQVEHPENELMLFDLGSPDWEVFDKLSDGLRESISKSPEYTDATNKRHAPPPPQRRTQDEPPPNFDDLNDDIPY